jgi:uncharacterized protein
MPFKRTMQYFLAVIVVAALGVAYMRYFETSNIYFPSRKIENTPAEAGLSYEDVELRTADGVAIHGWFVPFSGRARATVLFCHGNGGNIGDRVDIIRILNGLGLNVMIFDYRGYGTSAGRPSEKGTYFDADAAYVYTLRRENDDPGRVIVYGKSLGGAVGIDLVTRKEARALIVDSAFTSIPEMARELYPGLPVGHFLSAKYDSISKIGKADIPTLIIHSIDDETVPLRQGQALFDAASDPKEFYAMRGDHNGAVYAHEDEFKARLDGFLKEQGV